eukprot:6296442-Pyramimonas_sp.AAC.1
MDNIDSAWAYSDPGNRGTSQFKPHAGKVGFLRKWRGKAAECNNGDTLWRKNNDPIEKRLVDKTFGQ